MNITIGDIIACPKCNHAILECIEIPVRGERNWDKFFLAIDTRVRNGSVTTCNYCTAIWMDKTIGMHVRGKGWTW